MLLSTPNSSPVYYYSPLDTDIENTLNMGIFFWNPLNTVLWICLLWVSVSSDTLHWKSQYSSNAGLMHNSLPKRREPSALIKAHGHSRERERTELEAPHATSSSWLGLKFHVGLFLIRQTKHQGAIGCQNSSQRNNRQSYPLRTTDKLAKVLSEDLMCELAPEARPSVRTTGRNWPFWCPQLC